ncbi:MAG: hypothetical protein ACRDIV_22590, partial [Ktedonobacteraceae bacterium]
IKRAAKNAQLGVACVWRESSSSFSRGELRFACTLDKQHSIYSYGSNQFAELPILDIKNH